MSQTTLKTKILLCNDTTANWASSNKVLLKGEMGIEFTTDGTPKIKIGDGKKSFSELSYAVKTPQEVQDLISSLDSKLQRAISDAKLEVEGQLSTHTSSTNNPHHVTASQVGAAEKAHSHTIADVTNLQSTLNGKQASITGGASTITNSNLTASRALISNASGKVAVSDVTATELGYLDGVTSNVQTQLDGKAPTSHAASGMTYGAGSSSNYGHVKLSDSTSSSFSTANGTAATPKAVKAAYDLAANKARTATLVVAANNSTAKSKAAADYVCDGTADQTEINNAITALPSTGGKIVLLEGTYNISGSINVSKDNVTIEGMGAGTVLKRMFNDSTSSEWIGGVIYADTRKNIIISDILFDGNQSPYTGQYNGNIKFSNISHCIIENTYHSNVRGTAIAIFGGSSNNSVVNNIIQTSLRWGIYLYYASNNIIRGNIVMNTEKGIVLEYLSKNNKISDNYIIRGTGSSSNYTSTQDTIQIISGTNNVVTDNYIYGKNYTNNGGNTNTFKNNVWQSTENTVSGRESAVICGTGNNVTGNSAAAAGSRNTASGVCSFVSGESNTASGDDSFIAGGDTNTASGAKSFIAGVGNKALDYQAKFGHYAVDGTAGNSSGTTGDAFAIGNGSGSSKSNAFRVSYAGQVYGKASFNSTGADYAEFFEWADGNSGNEDRIGLFVTLDGDKIQLANSGDDYILGAISGSPGVVGNNHADTWQGMWMTDIYGRVLTHTVHHDAEYEEREIKTPREVIDKETSETTIEYNITKERVLVHEAYDAVEPVVNPDYDPDEIYVPRDERPEWGIVGMMGQLIVIDDGTCEVNGNCTVGKGGIATSSENGWRVIARLDETHIKILFR